MEGGQWLAVGKDLEHLHGAPESSAQPLHPKSLAPHSPLPFELRVQDSSSQFPQGPRSTASSFLRPWSPGLGPLFS